MKRLAYYDLLEWLDDSHRKPILLFGARQVGKTHLVRILGEKAPNFVEINLEKHPAAAKIFTGNLDPVRMIRELSLVADQPIIPGKTLLFLDEIQEEPRAVTALRYFYEEMPELHVIAAGSLLDFAIEKVGVPVGRITIRWIYPMTFIEFLCTLGHQMLADAIISQPPNEAFNDAIHEKALSLLGEYMAIGGMPEAVFHWKTQQDVIGCQQVHTNIVSTYEKDFPKYANKHQIKYVELLFNQIPVNITKSFNYGLLNNAYRKRELEPALMLLEQARIVQRVVHSHGNGIPLGAELDSRRFKLIMADIALTQSIIGLPIKDWFLDPAINLVNKGDIAEALIGQEMLGYNLPTQRSQLFYWSRQDKGGNAEVDYLIQRDAKIIPVEVKSGHGSQLQSLRLFLNKRPESPYGIRFSTYNFSYVDQLQNYPLYAVACITKDKKLLRMLIDDR